MPAFHDAAITIQMPKKPSTVLLTQARQLLRLRIQICCATLLALVLFGSAGVFTLMAQESARQAVSGLVLDAFTHAPVTDALVRVSSPAINMNGVRDQRPGLFDGQTDSHGRFRIPVPPNPNISLNVFARGYVETAGRSSLAEW